MKQLSVNYFVIVPAAGIGTRMQVDIPKQYLSLKGKKIIEYTLSTLLSHTKFKKYVVVLNKNDKNWPSLQLSHTQLITALGGNERCHSVFNGLLALKPFVKENDWVLIHDAVRPLLHHSDIDKLINHVADHTVGGLLANSLKNTVKRLNNNHQVIETLNRDEICQAVTPQMFRYHWLVKALTLAIEKKIPITDEANAIELLGQLPKMVEGRSDNIKVTDKDDLTLLNYYLSIRPDLLNTGTFTNVPQI